MGWPGADPENIESGGATVYNYQAEPGGANYFCLAYKGEQGGVRRVHPPLNPRLVALFNAGQYISVAIGYLGCFVRRRAVDQ